MSEFRIISSIPGEKLASAFKAQVKVKFLFWSFWVDLRDFGWRHSISDCEKDIKYYKGEISNVVKEIN